MSVPIRQPTLEEKLTLSLLQSLLLKLQIAHVEGTDRKGADLRLMPVKVAGVDAMVIGKVEAIEEVGLGSIQPLAVIWNHQLDEIVELPGNVAPLEGD